jgi:hypothetical protein
VARTWDDRQVDSLGKLPRGTERVSFALDDVSGDAGRQQLAEPGLVRTAGWMKRKRECEAAGCAKSSAGAQCDPGPRAASPDHQGCPNPEIAHEMFKGLVEKLRCGSDAAAREHPRLLNAHHRDVVLGQPLGEGDQIGGADTATCTMSDHQGCDWAAGSTHEQAGSALGSRNSPSSHHASGESGGVARGSLDRQRVSQFRPVVVDVVDHSRHGVGLESARSGRNQQVDQLGSI